MALNSRQVEAFRAVMLDGGMTAATASLHITQPAVSRLIRDLEYEVGLSLFYRRGNKIIPTAEAFDLLAEVERSFVGLEAVKSYADNLRGTRAGSLRIAALPALAAGFLPRFVASFCRHRPEVRIRLDGLPSHLVVDRVAGGQFDVGICAMVSERPSLAYTAIEGSAVVLLPTRHRLAKLKEIKAADLAGESIILLGRGSHTRHLVEAALQSVSYRQVIEASWSVTACALAASGAGVTIVDPFAASDFAGKTVAVRPFIPRLNVGFRLIRSSNRPQSRLSQQFIAEFQAHIGKTLGYEARKSGNERPHRSSRRTNTPSISR